MTQNDGDLLGEMLAVGVPTALHYKGDDIVLTLASLFDVSKRQMREWYDQKAVKFRSHGAWAVIKVGKKHIGIVISVGKI